jgi:hypothetical protein
VPNVSRWKSHQNPMRERNVNQNATKYIVRTMRRRADEAAQRATWSLEPATHAHVRETQPSSFYSHHCASLRLFSIRRVLCPSIPVLASSNPSDFMAPKRSKKANLLAPDAPVAPPATSAVDDVSAPRVHLDIFNRHSFAQPALPPTTKSKRKPKPKPRKTKEMEALDVEMAEPERVQDGHGDSDSAPENVSEVPIPHNLRSLTFVDSLPSTKMSRMNSYLSKMVYLPRQRDTRFAPTRLNHLGARRSGHPLARWR